MPSRTAPTNKVIKNTNQQFRKKAVPAAPSLAKIKKATQVTRRTTITLSKTKEPLPAKVRSRRVEKPPQKVLRVTSPFDQVSACDASVSFEPKKKNNRTRPRDKTYKCFYCKAPKEGKYSLRRHHYNAHLHQLAADLNKEVAEVAKLFDASIRNENGRTKCRYCKEPFSKRYVVEHETKRCLLRPVKV